MSAASSAPAALDVEAHALPRPIGPYTLFQAIGRGGMAELFLARTESALGATRLAVVKLVLPTFASDPKFAEMLTHEAKLAASLSHQHIVQVFDLGRAEGELYIAMEYVEGFDLNALLRLCTQRDVVLPPAHALGIVLDVLEGLDYAHRRKHESGAPLGLVHRDVSPSNILISYDGEVKLCDFGIAHAGDVLLRDRTARATDADALDDKTEALKGKAGYMSPEHARAEKLDARTDVFATGIILWELLAGRRLYRPRSEVPLLEQARRAFVPPLPDRGLSQPAELERIVRRALAANREERYASAEAFRSDLESYLVRASLLASRLKLGEWIATTFGTSLIEERRANERRLPKSVPPPRSSGAMRLRPAPSTSVSVAIPVAARVPLEASAFAALALDDDEASDPLVRAALPAKGPAAPIVLSRPSIEETMDRSAAPAESSAVSSDPPVAKEDSDEELLTWARRRGIVTFLIFCLIAIIATVIWLLAR